MCHNAGTNWKLLKSTTAGGTVVQWAKSVCDASTPFIRVQVQVPQLLANEFRKAAEDAPIA